MPDRILRLKTVPELTGLSRSTLYRKMQGCTFPRNIQISTRCACWRKSAIEEWMRNPMFYDTAEQMTNDGHAPMSVIIGGQVPGR